MQFPKHQAIETYGHCFALFEAYGRELYIYKILDVAGVPNPETDPFHTRLVKKPERYQNHPPDKLIIREFLGSEYQEFESLPPGSTFYTRIRDMVTEPFPPQNVFEKFEDAINAARLIIESSGRKLTVEYDLLPDQINLPSLVQIGDPMYGFACDVQHKPLKIYELTITEAPLIAENNRMSLRISAQSKHKIGGGLGRVHFEIFTPNKNNTLWLAAAKKSGFALYFTRIAASKAAQRYAQRIYKNIQNHLKL